MVPLLTGQLRLSQHRAHGTSLAIIMFVAASGALGYWRAGNIDWRLVLALAPGAVLGVYAGTKAMVQAPALQLRMLFGAFLLFVAFRQLVWHVSTGSPQTGAAAFGVEAAFGLAGGALAGVLGVGGGAIFVPAIVVFGLAEGAGDPQKVAQGVSLMVIVVTAMAGTFSNVRHDVIDVPTVMWTAPAAVVAAFGASVFANRLNASALEVTYGLVALFLALQIAYTTARVMRSRTMIEKV